MTWLEYFIGTRPRPELHVASRDLLAAITELQREQAEVLKILVQINQSVAKLLLAKSTEPEELSHAERAALLGLPPAMADLVDWDQVRRR